MMVGEGDVLFKDLSALAAGDHVFMLEYTGGRDLKTSVRIWTSCLRHNLARWPHGTVIEEGDPPIIVADGKIAGGPHETAHTESGGERPAVVYPKNLPISSENDHFVASGSGGVMHGDPGTGWRPCDRLCVKSGKDERV